MHPSSRGWLSGAVLAAWLGASMAAPATAHAQAAGQWRDGAHVYAKICGKCHDTGIGPVIKGRSLPPEYVQMRVRQGFRAMPPFRPGDLDDAELLALGRYIMQSPAPAGGKP